MWDACKLLHQKSLYCYIIIKKLYIYENQIPSHKFIQKTQYITLHILHQET